MNTKYMEYAIELAKKGEGHVNPNPMVGAVIVKNDRIISEGYHEEYGKWHAERNAILNCKEDMTGAEMYVTLEPCCHYGKTPPCTDIIIESDIKKVYIGCIDDNPKVAKKGIEILRNNGIEVVENVLEDKARALNEVFFHYIKNKTPYVVMKYAMTADGKLATATGKSKWITNQKAREYVHKTRNALMGIMVGIGTVLTDNPTLNCRIENGRNPIRIICDSSLRIPLNSNIVNTADKDKTIIAVANNYDLEKEKLLLEKGIEIIKCPNDENKIDLKKLIQILGEKGIDSILLEGGSELNFSALKAGIVNRVDLYIGSKIFGGNSKSPVGGMGIDEVEDCIKLKKKNIIEFDDDILIQYDVELI